MLELTDSLIMIFIFSTDQSQTLMNFNQIVSLQYTICVLYLFYSIPSK